VVNLFAQSQVVDQTAASTAGQTSSNLVTFSEVASSMVNTISAGDDPTRYKASNSDDSLHDFMSRPIEIYQTLITPGTKIAVNFNPWKEFLENKRVINRINNFNNLRGKLHVKFMINGNGFYYGKIIASYLPLAQLNDLELPHTIGDLGDICLATQRPHVFLDPCTSTGGQLDLPFFWYRDSLWIPQAEWENMGKIYIETINQLRNANGSTTPVRISCFAWMSDVQLSCPTTRDTTALIAQSEYNEGGIISRPLTALSNIARSAAGYMPSYKPFAMAASSILGVSAEIAKVFGYSRPPDISSPVRYTPKPCFNLSHYDVMDKTTKLSLDSKQELSIDPRISGLGPEDPLTIDSLVTRQNYIRSINWTTSQQSGTIVEGLLVWPYHYVVNSTALNNVLPSYALPVLEAKYWQGDMVLRVEVACSNFHKGRLLIMYDPAATSPGAITPETNVAYSYILDIAAEKDVTIEIPWSQPSAFGHRAIDYPLDNTPGTTQASATSGADNGAVAVFVLNELTAPGASTAPVEINFYVSWKPGFKIAGPIATYDQVGFDALSVGLLPNLANVPALDAQAEQVEADAAKVDHDPTNEQIDFTAGTIAPENMEMLVYGGEDIRTMRAFMKRPNLLRIWPVPVASGFTLYVDEVLMPRARGYYSNPGWANGFEYNRNSFLTLGRYAYAGFRGGIRYKMYTPTKGVDVAYAFSKSDKAYNLTAYTITHNFGPGNSSGDGLIESRSLVRNLDILSNTPREMQYSNQTPAVEAEFPFYSRMRFKPTSAQDYDERFPDNPEEPGKVTYMRVNESATNSVAREFVSAGEDFQLYFFTGLPPVVKYTDPFTA
jgi:hypothetical protein